MSKWTSAVGAVQLARMLAAQQPAGAAAAGARRGPAYRDLADGVRLLVTEGRLAVAARLPAERGLAAALGVSRTTVAAAYEELRARGFAVSRRGAGTWTALPPGRAVPTAGLQPLPPEQAGAVIDLGSAALPAPEPWLSSAAASAAADIGRYTTAHGHYPAGLPLLREAVAERFTARGLPTSPDQVLVTTGAMGALNLLLGHLSARGDRGAVEAPSYANALQQMRRAGVRQVPVGTGPEGWDMGQWRRVLRDAAPRFAYVVPDFHNPTGVLVPEEQRRDLVSLARNCGTVLVVDETMAEMAAGDGVVLPRPTAALDPGGSTVVTVGSAGKVFWGGLRIGWLRGPAELVRRLAAERAHHDLGTPVLEQLLTHRLLTEHLPQVLAFQRARVLANRDAVTAALHRELPHWSFTVPDGGLTLWVRTGVSGARLAAAGEHLGVRIASGPRFGVDGAFEPYIRVPLTVGAGLADEAAARLAAADAAAASGRAFVQEGTGTFVA
ncbi:aminotransferase class I/II-fold pyridoxal phosphate-dependent enzyme [Streptomyces sp. SCUT-3]|uniref:MocR-like transcription factor YczR n=1 Tax=Streptomyces sp. SCUT-3 TaxID=2684469 RepID=UPI0015F8A3F4|nr:PLP-dependent aminotransferase family protein [Streptomyces sp. SCUT-3]QMV24448.1 aminotransferase class I/II-fold pyridoxal phosphate-dependent enzyme [Streptomyces sp. SCUT-3]